MRIAAIDTFIVTVPRDTPYLGPLAEGEHVNARGYIVRKGNGTIYPTVDRSIVVRVTAEDGSVGWGETYGICAPKATCEIVNDLLAPVLVGAKVGDIGASWDLLYGLMRVRGAWGGFHVDAIAAIDIALWDLKGKAAGKPVRELIGETVHRAIPGYLSGLPAATLEDRVALAQQWQARGIDAFKFAAVVSHEGIVAEMAALREALGDKAEILIDLHWKFSPAEAADLIAKLAPYRPGFVEAPVKPEDIAGLAHLAATSPVPVAAGEEWYTEYEATNRLAAGPLAYIQPEMGHTGITQFVRIARLAAAKRVAVAPHATVGTGIFLAASLQASATIPGLWKHEWQHSVFERNLALLDTDMGHGEGGYVLPTGPGLGVEPNARFWGHAERVA
ncbi:galactonate dehydratase [Sphingomonas kyeonggiensis]|uniref:Galactonate dehydratase n=1 Tax=Sphingomonas kyeonggiensis TaxID=1268553 RepID=A0A7W7NR12_9SPHN|nr:mandelate racemase/muconate lactonizing enzyme family protein [Sphingomonas kyeonggiensis]MBB4837332.1 galactonate dehydratase [Sphingomonas kyeonggiensis]